jgi:pimeloyl-ACP methyl ester carboxylesterase
MTSRTILKTGLFAGLALCLQIASTQIQLAAQQPAPQPGAAGQGGGRGGGQGAAVDPRVQQRTYLMGHSMGGAGTIYLGAKYASNWAAIGAIAPATAPAGLNPDTFSLQPAKDVPVILVQGDADTLVPVAGARRWIDKIKELNMTHQYVETAGRTHGSVMTTGMPDIFAFFAKYSK